MNITYFFTIMTLALLISPVHAEEKRGSHGDIKKVTEQAPHSKCTMTDPRCK